MKIQIISTVSFAFQPWEPIYHFKKNQIIDLEDSKALLLIESGYAKKYDETVKKMNKDESENKMFNVKHKEDKNKEKTKNDKKK